MKKFSVFLFVALLSIVLCTVSCDRLPHVSYDNPGVGKDSVRIAEAVQNITNPQFTTLNEVIEFRTCHRESQAIDSIFFSLPESVLQNVVTVLLKKNYASITKKDIIEEFEQHKDVYSNINTTSINVKNDSTKKIISTSYSYRTDTINGKPTRISIKTEESYE